MKTAALLLLAVTAHADEDLLTPDNPVTWGTLPAEPDAPDFVSRVAPLSDAEKADMSGVTWREGCPVGLDALSSVEVAHWGLDGAVHTGRLVVATAHADAIVGVFARLYAGRFPVQSVRPAREFGGDDDAMMAVNNTSAFNCRPVAGGKRYSDHSFGHALDLNPLINPYVRGQRVDPAQGRAYLDRDPAVPGLVVDGGPAVAAFADAGWKWGGHWKSAKDYQHFSATGR
jgi:poly-gamma-glutamate synthesis protein (capsule biosynthesis protein)